MRTNLYTQLDNIPIILLVGNDIIIEHKFVYANSFKLILTNYLNKSNLAILIMIFGRFCESEANDFLRKINFVVIINGIYFLIS